MTDPASIYRKAHEEACFDMDTRMERLFELFYADTSIYLSWHSKTLSEESKAILAIIAARFELSQQIMRDTLLALKREGFF